MTAESDTPDENVDTHPFADRVPLKGEVLRVLEDEVAEVKDGTQPVVPREDEWSVMV